VDIPGVEPPPGRRAVVLDGRVVGPGYLTALGVGLLAGRDVREADLDGPPVAIVSESFIRRFRPDSPAIGWTLTVAGRQAMVVGVATDARYVVQDAEPEPLVYLSRRRAEVSGPIHVTVRGEFPSGLGASVADVVMTSFPGARRPELRRVRETLDEALLPQRMGALLVGTMGLGALLLSTVGLYGLVHYTVSRDTHELGVRLALGGGRRDVVRVVLQKGFRLAAFGTAAGVLFALLAAPALRPFLGDVSPADPVTYVAVVACFAVVALVASWVPARRALSIDATEALRGGD
jgi:hypothetical protein